MMDSVKRDPRRNASGCLDMTAFEAVGSVSAQERRTAAEDKRVSDLIFILKYVVRTSGFELCERIAVRDKRTGKEYR